jgi:hypothetical protein
VLLAKTIKEAYTIDVAVPHHQEALEVKRLERKVIRTLQLKTTYVVKLELSATGFIPNGLISAFVYLF